MTSLNTIVGFLNKELSTKKIHDSSRNGLQARGTTKINTVGFAVDASMTTFKHAKKLGVNLLIVHHGLLWKKQKDISGLRARRIAFLKKNKISLYASHLPLDLHAKFGNNIILARMLGVEDIRTFGRYGGMNIGFRGRFKKPRTLRAIATIMDRKINAKSKVLSFGPRTIRTVGIISGGGASVLEECAMQKLDCFITGELGHTHFNVARDLEQNVIISGHYATETVGVRALMPILKERFGVKTVFIDAPTKM